MNRSLATRTLVRIWIPTAILFLALLAVTYYYGRNEAVRRVETQSRDLVRYHTARFEGKFRRVEAFTRMVAVYVESHPALDSAGLTSYMSAAVSADSEVYGSCVAFEPGSFVPGRDLFAPYYYYREGETRFVQLGTEEYDYPQWQWYDVPRHTSRPTWSEPYFDTGGGEAIMITHSAPFFRDGRFRGVATADVSLVALNDEVRRIRVAGSGYAFIISRSGRFISYPDSSKVMTARLADVSPDLADQMTSGLTGFVKTVDPLSGRPSWIIYSPVPATSLSLAIVFPVREVMARVFRFERSTLLLAATGLLLLMFIVVLVARSVARPITELAAAVRRVGHGRLEFRAPTKVGADEVGELTSAFDTMVRDLNRYVRELERTTAERERIASELDIAWQIQQSILPGALAPDPSTDRFDVEGRCVPAREVGGDFYDFFLLGTGRLGFLIGDVSGKGIPAALFMAMARTLLRSAALSGVSPAECLSRVNRLLVEGNAAMMFVTVFYGILDAATGQVSYANAGHPAPYVLKSNGVIVLPGDNGIALGVDGTARYETREAGLEPGQCLLLYTDGVTEAMDDRGAFYGTARLAHCLVPAACTATETLARLLGDVRDFVGSAEHSDDVTALALILREENAPRRARFVVANRISEIARLHQEVESLGKNLDLTAAAIRVCALALEEVVTNIVRHGYDDDKEHAIEVTASVDSDETIRLTVEDDGRPFNPLDAPTPDTDSPLEARPLGGLGIHIVRNVMDDARYERRAGRNILTLTRYGRSTQEDSNESKHA